MLAEHAVYASKGLMWTTLDRLGLTLKKNSLRVAAQERPDVAAARRAWHDLQPRLKPERLVFLDETWTKTSMARLRGRSRRGMRLMAAVPHGHWRTSTFIAGLRHDRIIAPLVVDGAMNDEMFRTYIEQFPAPTLAPSDIVVADNLSSHKTAGVRETIEARGANLLYLPPYSRDLNPIEQVLAQLKQLLRSAAARTREALWETIGGLLDRSSSRECAAYFANAGYTQSA